MSFATHRTRAASQLILVAELNTTCLRCGQPGHWAAQCPQSARPSSTATKRPAPGPREGMAVQNEQALVLFQDEHGDERPDATMLDPGASAFLTNTQALRALPGYNADFDQCRYGAMRLDTDGLRRPVQKSTRLRTTKKIKKTVLVWKPYIFDALTTTSIARSKGQHLAMVHERPTLRTTSLASQQPWPRRLLNLSLNLDSSGMQPMQLTHPTPGSY